jgi:hypothetical protein
MSDESKCTACGKTNKTPQYGPVCIKCLSAAWDQGKAGQAPDPEPEETKTDPTAPDWYTNATKQQPPRRTADEILASGRKWWEDD